MPIWQFVIVVVHIFSAIIWIGGSIFLALVMVPVARGMEPPAMGMLFLRRAAIRFRGIAWVLLTLLVLSGAAALESRGIGFDRFNDSEFWSTEIGTALAIKFVLVGALLVISGVHDFVLGPRVSDLMQQVKRGEQAPASTVAARKRLVMLARFNLLIAIAAAVVGIMLVRGVPG
ncbi:MAG: CopD family protein [Chloroflexi bacterium]|nr:CopD family protein [Chloroflexota bacterium]